MRINTRRLKTEAAIQSGQTVMLAGLINDSRTKGASGVPGLSLPCGLAASGLPIGIQLVSRHFDEARLLKAAHNLEQAIGFDFKPRAIGGLV